jgi:hypothetical protein
MSHRITRPAGGSAGFTFLAVLLVGGIGLTIANRPASIDDRPDRDVTKEDVTPRQQAAIEAQRATSTLIFNLAFGSLAALIGLRFSDKTAPRLTGPVPVVASGLLGLSLYSAHLLNSNIDFALTHGPIGLINGPATEMPGAAQFWTFVIAIFLLAWWALSTRKVGVASIAIVVAGLTSSTASAAGQEKQTLSTCVTAWSTERRVPLSTRGHASAVTLVSHLQVRAKAEVPSDETCWFAGSSLDGVRREALDDKVPEKDLPAWVEREVASLVAELTTPNFSPGKFLETLLVASAVWRQPSGLLAIQSRIGTVAAIATLVGAGRDWRYYTDCEIRLPEGRYIVRFAKDGKRVGSDQTVQIVNSRRMEIVVNPTP